MDEATFKALIQVFDSIEEVRAGGAKVAQRTLDALELLTDRHLALEERVTELEEDVEHHRTSRGHA